jgi:glycerol-3-phosphate dehydrogenase (NAD(P)+)
MKQQVGKVAIIGAGAWGTALAQLFSFSAQQVVLWSYEQRVADAINQSKINGKYLEGHRLAENILAVTDIHKACSNTDIIVEAVPMIHLASVLALVDWKLYQNTPFVITSKGIYTEKILLPTDVVAQAGISDHQMVVLTGPTFAKELMKQDLSGFCIASKNKAYAQLIGKIISQEFVTCTYTEDLLGAQMVGALKNIIALGVGMVMGLGAGENLRALAFVKGFQEVYHYALRKGASAETMIGIAGLGDLLLTSLSSTSKNYRAGFLKASGRSRDEIEKEIGVLPEGCNTVRLSVQHDLYVQTEMLFCAAVYRVFWLDEDPKILLTVLRTEAV